MAFEIQLQTGPVKTSAGGRTLMRGEASGGLVSQDAHARYQEAVLQGRVFSTSVAAAGVAPGTALGASAAFAIYNPIGSKVLLVIWKLSMGYVSGTLGAGFIGACASTDTTAAAVTGSALTVVPALFGGPVSNKGKPFSGATLPATPTLLRPIWSTNAELASTATNPVQLDDEVAGEWILLPGTCLSLEGIAAAGASPLAVFGATWEELPESIFAPA